MADVTWQQATHQVFSINTIATLVYHTHYYVAAVNKVLKGGELEAHDKYSFANPPIHSQEDWDNLLNKVWEEAETFEGLLKKLPEATLWEIFLRRNIDVATLVGSLNIPIIILGQIAVIKKIIQQQEINKNK